jgi:hypothetical protein
MPHATCMHACILHAILWHVCMYVCNAHMKCSVGSCVHVHSVYVWCMHVLTSSLYGPLGRPSLTHHTSATDAIEGQSTLWWGVAEPCHRVRCAPQPNIKTRTGGRWAAGRQGDMASPTDAGWTPGENVPDMYRGKGGHVTSQAFHMLGNLLVNMQGVDVRRFVICFPQFDEFMRSPASGGKPTKKYAISRMVASIAGVNAGASELTA